MSILAKPYPRSSGSRKKLISAFIFGMFVFLFLLVFQPFGLNIWETDFKILKLAGYGMVTTVIILVNGFVIESIFKNWFAESNWTVGKEILSGVLNILVIGSLNLLYTHWLGVTRIDLKSFIAFQWITLIVGIIPVTMITIINQSRLQKLNTLGAKELNDFIAKEAITHPLTTIQQITIIAENGKDRFSFDPNSVLVFSAADNYVEIYYYSHDEVKKELIRTTLKNIEAVIVNYSYLIRCHRSYVVNLNCVKEVSGNSQGLKLHLAKSDLSIPVSRSLNHLIHEKLKHLHSIHP